MADPRSRAKFFSFHKRDLEGNKIGEPIRYSWKKLKDFYLDKSKDASKYDLDTEKGYKAFKKNAKKALNRELSPKYWNRKDRESKGRVPRETLRERERSWRESNPETSQRKGATYRARKLDAMPTESYRPAFKAEIDGLFHAAKIRPGEFNVDHIIRLVDGGLHHPENLQLLDVELHKLKTSLENAGRLEDAARIGAFNEYNLSPNVRELLAENVLGKKGLMNFLKPVAKTALRAVPFLGASMGVKAADDYRKSGNNRLAAAAAMSAVPGPVGWAGLAGEMGGLLWNKATEDPNFLFGPLDKRRHKPRQRGSL